VESILDGPFATIGDTDSDGWMEIVGSDRSSETYFFAPVVAERQPDNSYAVSYPLGSDNGIEVFATGDLDNDHRMEIIGQDGNRVVVYESPSCTSFPSQLVWTSPPLTNVMGYTTVADSDGDSRMEIIHSQNYFGGTARLVIFENTSDNEYVQVLDIPTPGNYATGEKVVLDLDEDGKKEIALCGILGYLYIFEAVGDNQWQEVWVDSTGLRNAYAAEGGTDSDVSGRPELFIMGNDFSVFPTTTFPTFVYEALADNEFQRVCSIPVPGYGGGETVNALGDLDGDGDQEYIALETRPVWDPPPGGLWIYAATSPGLWEPVEMLENPGNSMRRPVVGDLNDDGRADLLWLGTPTSRVWSYFPPSDSGSFSRSDLLTIRPNPFMRRTWIEWPSTDRPAGALLVYDVAGRLVERHSITGNAFNWHPIRVATGVYFLMLQDSNGAKVAAARAFFVPEE